MENCWHRIGVWGRETPRCPKLDQVIHCQNCDIFHAASLEVYEKPFPEGYRGEWTKVLAENKTKTAAGAKAVIIFRLGDEWVAIAANLCKEVSEMLKIHRLPHNKSAVLRGVVNSGGEVQLCFSLGNVLGIAKAESIFGEGNYGMYSRMIVMEMDGKNYLFPVSEIGGLHHYREEDLGPLPKIILASAASYMKGIIKWNNKSVGCLDEELVLVQLERSISY